MTPEAFRAALDRLGLTQTGAARAFRTGERSMRHWAAGDRAVPPAIELLLWACERDPTLLAALRGSSVLPPCCSLRCPQGDRPADDLDHADLAL